MTPTPQEIGKMSEAQFQKEVLVPLFRAMKFRAITNYGGGSLELGKDLVMWREEELRKRVNYGVVVKARKISGKATGKGSANEAYFQIKQCFDAPFFDLTSTEEQRVHRCWVISSKEITKEAINAIRTLLAKDNLDRITDFVGLERLIELIKEFMPEEGVYEGLESVQKKIDALAFDEHYRVVANTKKQFLIEPRYPGAEKDKPLQISARFEFDTNNAEALKSRDELIRHFKTGAPIKISAPHLKVLELPEFLTRLVRPSVENMVMEIGPARLDRRLTFKFEIINNGTVTAVLEYLDFQVVQAGTEELTLSNEKQPVPWKITLVINFERKQFDLKYQLSSDRLNVTQALQALRFHRAISQSGEFRMISLDAGWESTNAFTKLSPAEGDDRWISLFEELAFIQSKTGIPITVTDRDVSAEEVRMILVTSHILKTGHATFTTKHWPVDARVPQARAVVEGFSDAEPHSLTLNCKDGHKVTVFHSEIPLGPSVLFCSRAHITKKETKRIKTALDAAKPDDIIHYSIRPYRGCSVEARFLRWLPAVELEEIQQLPIFAGQAIGSIKSDNLDGE